MTMVRSLATALAVLSVAACSGGGSAPVATTSGSGTRSAGSAATSSPSPSPSGVPTPVASGNAGASSPGTRVTATLYIPIKEGAASASRSRRRDYIPPGTQGLVVVVDQITNGGSPVLYSTTGYTLTPTSTTQSGITNCIELTSTPTYECTIELNAPATDSLHNDAFYIYEYDSPQGNGAISNPSAYVPSGSLLAEDVGTSGGGDPVPSASNPSGIALDKNSSLAFNLDPAVAMPYATFGSVGGSPLILSVTGDNGSHSVSFAVDGLDADSNDIAKFLSGTGDNAYANPIAVASNNSEFVVNAASATQVNQSVKVSYNRSFGDIPFSATATATSGTVTLTESLTQGGYDATTNFPITHQSVEVAPLFNYEEVSGISFGNGGSIVETDNIYALQAAIPSGQSYSSYALIFQDGASQNCTETSQVEDAQPTATSSQRAEFTIAVSLPTGMGTCSILVTDGISTSDASFSVAP